MKVKELKTILESFNDGSEVAASNNIYSSTFIVNGYYVEKKDNKEIVYLTNLNVKPRT